MQNESVPQFGSLPLATEFVTRPGSYAVLFNKEKKLGLVRTDGGHFFLAGGGIEPGESKEDAVVREVMEETGLSVRIETYLGEAVEFFFAKSEQRHYKKVGHLFLAQPISFDASSKIEDDHHLVWMPIAEAMHKLFHDMYRWGVQEALRQKG